MALRAHTVTQCGGTGRAGAPGIRSRNQTSSAQCGKIQRCTAPSVILRQHILDLYLHPPGEHLNGHTVACPAPASHSRAYQCAGTHCDSRPPHAGMGPGRHGNVCPVSPLHIADIEPAQSGTRPAGLVVRTNVRSTSYAMPVLDTLEGHGQPPERGARALTPHTPCHGCRGAPAGGVGRAVDQS